MTQTPRPLTDYKTDKAVEAIPYPGLTPEDIAEFCAYFNVNFYSLEALTESREGLAKSDMFRVATNDVPSRGLDLTYKSAASWKVAIQERGAKVFEHGRYRLSTNDEVLTMGLATSDHDEDPIVVYRCADGSLKYLSEKVFFGVSYDRSTDTYRPNAVPMKS